MGELADDPVASRVVASAAMGSLLLLLADTAPEVELNAAVVEAWAALGITGVTVLRDRHTTAVALEGWAFDVDRSGDAAARVVAHPDAVRVLRPVIASAISPVGADCGERDGRP
jgi:hypothetical protein